MDADDDGNVEGEETDAHDDSNGEGENQTTEEDGFASAMEEDDDGFGTGHEDECDDGFGTGYEDEFEESFEENDDDSEDDVSETEEVEQEENDDTGILALIDATSSEMQSVQQEGLALMSQVSSKKRSLTPIPAAAGNSGDEMNEESSVDSVITPQVKRGKTEAESFNGNGLSN